MAAARAATARIAAMLARRKISRPLGAGCRCIEADKRADRKRFVRWDGGGMLRRSGRYRRATLVLGSSRFSAPARTEAISASIAGVMAEA
jgi:hypothetical protein